jgi:hypothetical protein
MSLKSYNAFVSVDIARNFIRAQAWAMKEDGQHIQCSKSIGLEEPLEGAPSHGFTNMVLMGFILIPGPMILFPEIGLCTHTHGKKGMPRVELSDKYLHHKLVEKLVRETYEDVVRRYWESLGQEEDKPGQ